MDHKTIKRIYKSIITSKMPNDKTANISMMPDPTKMFCKIEMSESFLILSLILFSIFLPYLRSFCSFCSFNAHFSIL